MRSIPSIFLAALLISVCSSGIGAELTATNGVSFCSQGAPADGQVGTAISSAAFNRCSLAQVTSADCDNQCRMTYANCETGCDKMPDSGDRKKCYKTCVDQRNSCIKSCAAKKS